MIRPLYRASVLESFYIGRYDKSLLCFADGHQLFEGGELSNNRNVMIKNRHQVHVYSVSLEQLCYYKRGLRALKSGKSNTL